jgi:hypothetical protein
MCNPSTAVISRTQMCERRPDCVRWQPGALTVDLAVRAYGRVSIEALRIDAQVLGH